VAFQNGEVTYAPRAAASRQTIAITDDDPGAGPCSGILAATAQILTSPHGERMNMKTISIEVPDNLDWEMTAKGLQACLQIWDMEFDVVATGLDDEDHILNLRTRTQDGAFVETKEWDVLEWICMSLHSQGYVIHLRPPEIIKPPFRSN
jgi:hypothetical protein